MLSDLLYRLRALFRRGSTEAELDEELLAHYEEQAQKYVGDGVPLEEARRRARLELGGLEQAKEECRDARGVRFIEELIQDIRYGLRQLRRNPGFTAVAIITLAVGIGATTAIFSVVDGILLKPLPYPHPNQLVSVWLTAPGINIKDLNPSAATYFVFRDQNRTFKDIGLYWGYSVNITGLAEPEHVAGLDVTAGLLPTLGIRPMLGRWFTRADDSPGSPDTIMLTYGYWRRKFAGDRSVVGRAIIVDGKPRQIIGVLPQSFHFGGNDLALLLPLQLDRAKELLGGFKFDAIARLKPGVSLAEANADVARMLPIYLRSFPPPPGYSVKMFEDARIGPNVRPLKQDIVGNIGSVLWVLMGGIGAVLLIACANVTNLLLVRVEGRRQELAIRAALGASRGRIAAQMLCESLTFALLGAALGLGLAAVALRALIAMAPAGLPRLSEIGIDGSVVLFALAVAFVATLLIGSMPVWKYAGSRSLAGLREGARSMSESRGKHRSRNVLVTIQVALALVLLISSGLMIRAFRALTMVDPGFSDPAHLQTFRISIAETEVKQPEKVARLQQEMLQRIRALPGVSSASLSMSVPMDGSEWSDSVFARNRTYAPGSLPLHRYRFVAPGCFKTLGTPLIAGRDFTWSDIYNDQKAPVAIVSERLAREYWRTPQSAIGKQVRSTRKDDWREVVGVVGNIHDDGVEKQAPSSVYWPILVTHLEGEPTEAMRWVAFLIRTPRAGSESLMNEVRRAVWSVDPNLPLADVHTLEYYEQASMARTSFTLVMLGLAGGMALLLAIVGLYGVIAYSVSQRTHEIGIRMALGAHKRDVLRLVLGQGMILILVGVGAGIVAALALTRFLSSLLYGVKPTDPLTFITVSLILTAVGLLASFIPARRAANIDPMIALQYE
jgi:putative ABC transport system permease protein